MTPISIEQERGIDIERKAAEQEYTITAFDYVRNPVGSRDWCIFWQGWQARAAIPQAPGEAAMLDWLESMGNQPEGLLLHDGGDFTGRCGLGLRRIGRTLREACKQAMGTSAAKSAPATTEEGKS